MQMQHKRTLMSTQIRTKKYNVMEFITITVGSQCITSKQAIKYLGMVIDNRLTFREHLTYIDGKCAATSYALVQRMPNLEGPKQQRRWLLMKVVTSIAI